ncbi:MAG: zinc-binding dehydrogenase [Alphaproteobacteria bacterium]|nr:zinc-binding dehydrogenase [Alphaproteobacteria bacterium]
MRPHVSHTFSLEETAAALRTVVERRSTGKVVVSMDVEG